MDGVRLDNISMAVSQMQSQIIDLDTNVSSRWLQLALQLRDLETLEQNTSAALDLLELHTLRVSTDTDELAGVDAVLRADLDNVNSSLQEVLGCCSDALNATETLGALANLSTGHRVQSARIAELKDTVASLESEVLAQSTTIASQNASIVAQQREIAALAANFSALYSVVAALVEGASFVPTTMAASGMSTSDIATTVDCLADSESPCTTGSPATVGVSTAVLASSTTQHTTMSAAVLTSSTIQHTTTERATGMITDIETSTESSVQSVDSTFFSSSRSTSTASSSSAPPPLLLSSEAVSPVTTVSGLQEVSTMNANTLATNGSSASTKSTAGYSTMTAASASNCGGGVPCGDPHASTGMSTDTRSTQSSSSRPSTVLYSDAVQVTTPSVPSTEEGEASVTLTLCQGTSCASGFALGDPAVVLWSRPVFAMASPLSGIGGQAVSNYDFRLTDAEGALKWRAQASTNETSFLPSDFLSVDEIGEQPFTLEVTLGLSGGQTAVSSFSIFFTAAPVIHQISLTKMSSPPGSALSRYTLLINASSDDTSTLSSVVALLVLVPWVNLAS